MTDIIHLEASSPPILGQVGLSDIGAALAAGLRDFRRAPVYGLFFAGFFVGSGLIILLGLELLGREFWVIPVGLGFPLVAPFLAVGLYEVSRRLEQGEALEWRGILGVIWRQKDRQFPSMAMVIIMFFMFWIFIAHMIFALFLGLQTMTNVSSDILGVLFTQNGLTMLAVGTLIGSVMAYVLFSLTAISLPMLLDREMDFITAMINSFQLVAQNLLPMMAWGLIISVLSIAAMLPYFLGLFLVLPVLGHATWHLYRRAVSYEG